MNDDERIQQLSFSAQLQYTETPESWHDAMKVTPQQSGYYAEIKYHFKMCFDLSMHLTIVDDDSPLKVTLNYLFNFALIELRLAEFIYLNYLMSQHWIGFETGQQKLLFVLAQSLFRVRESMKTQYRQLLQYNFDPRLFDVGDQPFAHHTEKQLMTVIFKSIKHLSETMKKGLLIFKGAQESVDKDFWEQVACRLGFVIHMLNRVLVVAPAAQTRK